MQHNLKIYAKPYYLSSEIHCSNITLFIYYIFQNFFQNKFQVYKQNYKTMSSLFFRCEEWTPVFSTKLVYISFCYLFYLIVFWNRYLGAIKQYLCLSLLKNSALTVMSVFQLLCSIFTGLVLRFRAGLKEEIGIFFPMLVLRVLENVPQPSFLQKMTVLNLLEKICQDPQAIVDIFVNYDCDVDAPNIFERYETCAIIITLFY